MYTYIKNDIIGNYYTSEIAVETIPGYEDEVGTTWEEFLMNKFILLTPEQLAFYDANPYASVSEVFNMQIVEPEIPVEPERTIENAKDEMRQKIFDYDMSENVNAFYIGENLLWLDKNIRAGLKLRFEAESAMGVTATTLWYGTTSYTLPLNIAMQMLLQIECYASQCYDNTQSHYAALENLSTIEEVDAFDFTAGYPEKLVFTLG